MPTNSTINVFNYTFGTAINTTGLLSRPSSSDTKTNVLSAISATGSGFGYLDAALWAAASAGGAGDFYAAQLIGKILGPAATLINVGVDVGDALNAAGSSQPAATFSGELPLDGFGSLAGTVLANNDQLYKLAEANIGAKITLYNALTSSDFWANLLGNAQAVPNAGGSTVASTDSDIAHTSGSASNLPIFPQTDPADAVPTIDGIIVVPQQVGPQAPGQIYDAPPDPAQPAKFYALAEQGTSRQLIPLSNSDVAAILGAPAGNGSTGQTPAQNTSTANTSTQSASPFVLSTTQTPNGSTQTTLTDATVSADLLTVKAGQMWPAARRRTGCARDRGRKDTRTRIPAARAAPGPARAWRVPRRPARQT